MNNKAIIEFGFCRIWRTQQFSEGFIHLGIWFWWITPSLICRIHHILRKPNSVIANYLVVTKNYTGRVKKIGYWEPLFQYPLSSHAMAYVSGTLIFLWVRKGCIQIISHHADCQVGGMWYCYWHMWDRWKVLLPHKGDRFWWCNQLQNNKEYQWTDKYEMPNRSWCVLWQCRWWNQQSGGWIFSFFINVVFLFTRLKRFRPSNPRHMQIWRFWKKSPEKPGDKDLKPWDFKNMRQMKTTMTDYLFHSILYLISALCFTVSCCTVTMRWHPKPWVSRSNLAGWKVWRLKVKNARFWHPEDDFMSKMYCFCTGRDKII